VTSLRHDAVSQTPIRVCCRPLGTSADTWVSYPSAVKGSSTPNQTDDRAGYWSTLERDRIAVNGNACCAALAPPGIQAPTSERDPVAQPFPYGKLLRRPFSTTAKVAASSRRSVVPSSKGSGSSACGWLAAAARLIRSPTLHLLNPTSDWAFELPTLLVLQSR